MAKPNKHILIIPYPAQGHLIPLLDLAHLLSLHHGFSLSILITPQNLPFIQPFLLSTPAAAPLIFPLPSHPDTPSGIEHSRHLPPHIHHVLLNLPLSLLRPEILSWAKSTPNPISFIISDFFLGWTEPLAREIGVPRISFLGIGAFASAVLDYTWIHLPKPNSETNELVRLASLPSSPSFAYPELPQIFRNYEPGNPSWEFIRDSFLANFRSWGVVVNTFDALESDYISYLKKFYGHDRVWAVGPIQPTGSITSRGGNSSLSSEELATWLATCPPKSVVYVCFGSQYTPSEAQSSALASALELSGARFIWAFGGSLPGGFEERTKGRGLIIRGWAPQVEILHHAAVGSFVTHCGWNSVLEGVVAGVTLLTWPMKAEQFINAKLVLEGVGMAMKAAAGSDSVPEPEKLSKVFVESVEVEGVRTEVREKAVEMQREAAMAVKEGGSSHRDLLDFVKALSFLNLMK